MNDLLNSLGAVVVAFALAFLDIFLLIKVYNLTILPLGAPTLSMWQMYGVSLFFGPLTYTYVPLATPDDTGAALIKAAFMRTGAILFAWMLAHFIFG